MVISEELTLIDFWHEAKYCQESNFIKKSQIIFFTLARMIFFNFYNVQESVLF